MVVKCHLFNLGMFAITSTDDVTALEPSDTGFEVRTIKIIHPHIVARGIYGLHQ